MAWSLPTAVPWNPNIQMTPDINIGTYTPEQWALMQQQNWQQWSQWQQQYAQWQSQYGDKYAQQMQSFQVMAGVPPVPPPSAVPPPMPPPPDKPPPPPPPHENDQPLYLNQKQSSISPPVQLLNNNQGYNSTSATTSNNQNFSYTTNTKSDQQLPVLNTEALNKLAEEERLFDIQFKKWEDEIEKWRKENVNHPDKQAYKEYEQRFESCRVQLLERRQQMKQKRAGLTINPSQVASAATTGNISKNVPLLNSNAIIYSQNMQTTNQTQKNISSHIQNKQNIPQHQQYNNTLQQVFNRHNNITINTQQSFESYLSESKDISSQPTNSNFLPSSQTKVIPGLDLVPVVERFIASKQQDVIDITEENFEHKHSQPLSRAPDYSKISKGINNILGDEKIMNILSMVTSQTPPGTSEAIKNTGGHYTQVKNLWDGDNSNYQNIDYGNRQQMPYKQQNVHNYSNTQEQPNSNYHESYQNYEDFSQNVKSQEQYYDGHTRNMPPRSGPPPVGQNAPGPRPLIPNWGPQQNINDYSNIGINRREMQNQRAINPLIPEGKSKWLDEPLFTPSVIVNYEHKPLRLKAGGFIEPVHMFDYNHKSKDGESSHKKNFEKEIDDLFIRKPPKADLTDEWNESQKAYFKDYERKPVRDVQRDRSKQFSRDGHNIYNRRSLSYTERRRDDRDRLREDYERRDKGIDYDRFGDFERERDYRRERDFGRDLGRDRNNGRDRDLGRDRNCGRDRDLGRDRDYAKERDLIRDRDYGRDRDTERDEFGRDRDLARDRDIERDRERIGRDRDPDREKEGRHKDLRRDDSRNRSRSLEKDNLKREHSRENDSIDSSGSKRIRDVKEDSKTNQENKQPTVMIDDLLEPPGRDMRPGKIVIILRGPPGSGKSYLAKLIRDKEAEHGGTVRIMSIDDYFMQECEIEETDPNTGKTVKKPSLKYEYDEKCAEAYINSLKRAFRRSLTDGYFTFLIYDAVNEYLKTYADVWNFARQCGFQVYTCTMELDPQTCFKRNIHNRSLRDIEVISSSFYPTPAHQIQLDATTLLQSASITDVQMEDADDVTMEESTKTEHSLNSKSSKCCPSQVESSFTSKWEKMDDAVQLARLDGTNKPLRPSQLSMEDYLQLDDWKPNAAKPGKKTVRWADIEESRQQEKMRAIGFVVGQTDWNRMTDPTMGSSALTQTKYIERVRRF